MPRSIPPTNPYSRRPVALDDPVPSGSSTTIVAPDFVDGPLHAIETAVRKQLCSQEGVCFKELVVRRVQDGVCLEGVMQIDDDYPDVTDLVRQIAGVDKVINHLLILPLTASMSDVEEPELARV